MSRPIFHSCVQCIIQKEDTILLQKRQNCSRANNMYSLPGGHLEYLETPLEAIIRELKEELNLIVLPNNLTLFKVIKRGHLNLSEVEYIDFIFKYNYNNEYYTNNEPDKCSELVWSSIDNLPKNIISHIPLIFNTQDLFIKYVYKEE